jgi:hypothetical protein|tara:strand:- start:225 stop:632 length:408 start_codon:yes stop_codon:yes gene_type:complete
MNAPAISTEEITRAYIKVRTRIEKVVTEHKLQLKELEDSKDLLADALLEHCNMHGMDSFKTDAGTVTRKVRSRYWAADWEAMYDYVNKHKAPHLMEKRIHSKNMVDHLEDNPEDVPEGLQVDKKYVVSVRKPTST